MLTLLAWIRNILAVTAALAGIAVGLFYFQFGPNGSWEVRILTSTCLGVACTMLFLMGALRLQEWEQHLRQPGRKKPDRGPLSKLNRKLLAGR